MSNRTRSIARSQNSKKDFEQLAADARKKRQEACAKEFDKFLPELTKRHNCQQAFAVFMGGQWIPIEQVLNLPVALVFRANIEGTNDPPTRP